MSDDTLNDEGPSKDDSLSETIAAALEEDRGEDIIAELSSAETAARETPETDDEATSNDGNGAETPGGEDADQTEDIEPTSAEAREAADTGPERDTETADAHRQVAEALTAAVAPYQQYLASRGVEPTQAVRVLLAAEHQLSTGTPERKAQIFAKLAKDYGIDLGALADLEDTEPVNPEIAQLHQRLGGIERAITGQRQQGEAQVRQSVEAEVATFEKEKDTAGNLLRPHMGKVGAAMGRMIGKDPSLTLQAAYDSAVQADPKLHKALAKQRAAPAAKRGKSGKARVTPAREPNLHDTVTEAFRRGAERAGA